MQLESAVAKVHKRGAELKAMGPGRVEVDRIHNIDQVRALRACQETLTQDEKFEIRQAILELQSSLIGIEVATAPPKPTFWHRFMRMKEARTHEYWQHLSTTAGGPAQLPPPAPLLDAAEAWLAAHITVDRVDIDSRALTAPWENATVRVDDQPNDVP